eukprot:1709591-Amphidinium_carterae.1
MYELHISEDTTGSSASSSTTVMTTSRVQGPPVGTPTVIDDTDTAVLKKELGERLHYLAQKPDLFNSKAHMACFFTALEAAFEQFYTEVSKVNES